CAGIRERLDHLRHGGALLADGDVDAYYVAALLIDDRIDGDRRLTSLAIADDQLALSAADGDHRVDGLDSGLQRLLDRHPIDHAGSEALDGVELLGIHRTLAVNRCAERIHHAADHLVAHRNRHDAARALHLVAFLNDGVIA